MNKNSFYLLLIVIASFLFVCIAISYRRLKRGKLEYIYKGLILSLSSIIVLIWGLFINSTYYSQLELSWIINYLTLKSFKVNHGYDLRVGSFVGIASGLLIILAEEVRKIIGSSKNEKLVPKRVGQNNSVKNSLEKKYVDASLLGFRFLGLLVVICSPFIFIIAFLVQWKGDISLFNNELFAPFLLYLILTILSLPLAIYIRKYLCLKVTVTKRGIVYYAIFKRFKVDWEEIHDYEIVTKFIFGDVVKLITKCGIISFPITMQEVGEYPRLSLGIVGTRGSWKWIERDGTEKPVEPENCPLLQEIYKQVEKKY